MRYADGARAPPPACADAHPMPGIADGYFRLPGKGA